MQYIVLIGRILYSLIFISSGINHFSRTSIDYANSQGVPMATFLVPASGILALVGGLSILAGYKAKFGAWLIVAFLIPITLMMHGFWKFNDPSHHQMQMTMFMKNASMLGAAFLLTWFGAGPVSFDERKESSN